MYITNDALFPLQAKMATGLLTTPVMLSTLCARKQQGAMNTPKHGDD